MRLTRTLRVTTLAAALTCGAVLLLRAAAPAPAAPQGPQATFRAGVDLVDVEVSVLDKYRLPVQGLTADDFTVYEEGSARPVVAFSSVDLPPRERQTAKWMDDVAPDIVTNDFVKEGRLIIILFDQSIDPIDGDEARRIAEAAVDQMRPNDLAAVAWTVYGVPQNFTADRQLLIDAIRRPSMNLPGRGTAQSALCYCGACGMELMAQASEAVQDIRQRRKILIFIGHRLPSGMGGCGSVVNSTQRRVLRAAEVGNLTIHVIDPKGVMTLAGSASDIGSAPRETNSSNLRRVATLTTYTGATGGRFVTQNNPSAVMPQVFRESGFYYVLGFQPAYTGTDGKFRRISVKVNRPDVTVQARGGFYAPGRVAPRGPKIPKGLSPTLAGALASLWPKTDVRLSLAAVPIAQPGVRGGTVVALLNVAQDLSPNGPLGLSRALLQRPEATRVEILTGAFDASGVSYGYDKYSLDVRPRQTGASQFQYEVASRLTLKPGRYEIRTAVQDATLGQTGSAYTYVTVPDYAGELISLSGVFLQALPGATFVSGAALRDLVPVVPTTRRLFARTDRVVAYVQAYQGQARATLPGFVTTEVFDDTNQRVYRQEQRIVPDNSTQRTLDITTDVPVGQLVPGPYLLTISVRHGNDNAHRDVRFDVQ